MKALSIKGGLCRRQEEGGPALVAEAARNAGNKENKSGEA
jgi:hypothetical protein